jgi:hypothetical protein
MLLTLGARPKSLAVINLHYFRSSFAACGMGEYFLNEKKSLINSVLNPQNRNLQKGGRKLKDT